MVVHLPGVLEALNPQQYKNQNQKQKKAKSDVNRICLVSKVAKITGSLEAGLWNTANNIPKALS